MTHRGRCTLELTLDEPRAVSIGCDDPVRGSYVDFYRPDSHRETRRILEPGDREFVELAAGTVEITLGQGAVLEDYA